MTKKEKRINKLLSNPTPKDLKWKELVAALRALGFEEKLAKNGSHRCFIHTETKTIMQSGPRPHGGTENSVKPNYIEDIKDKLEEMELI
jgi:predicted RNA binding protein YcfA (HicA-like mRNA interferase family)